MTVKYACEDTASGLMAKRQKTDSVAKDVQDPIEAINDTPSDLMLGLIGTATRTPDMNIVEFISDDISDIEIIPGSEPLSDSDLLPRPEKANKKKRRRTKGEKPQKLLADNEKTQKKDKQSSFTNTDAQAYHDLNQRFVNIVP
ncbi:uncharacterized protein LOC123553783 [Mercenaria mercenaria]|uniref:uncharacterized protein LOC123553783 n=1 Tax=Mercenaria mercenaria TaxID=6596 RepID=UPI001E1DF188|nr:uncharacterized protein LOC123553783 [Mercenaria mercenaria]XP_045199362.1 uncharacterized protein LOC123553783 [Mercenaria mercenaria]